MSQCENFKLLQKYIFCLYKKTESSFLHFQDFLFKRTNEILDSKHLTIQFLCYLCVFNQKIIRNEQ